MTLPETQHDQTLAPPQPPAERHLEDPPLRFRLLDLFYTMVLLALLLAMVVNESETRTFLEQAELQSRYAGQLELQIEAAGYTPVYIRREGTQNPRETTIKLVPKKR